MAGRRVEKISLLFKQKVFNLGFYRSKRGFLRAFAAKKGCSSCRAEFYIALA